MTSSLPLLMIAEGRRPRPRRAPVPRETEHVLHYSVADLLRRFVRSEWRWTHFPAGERRDVRTGARLKRMGLRRGWPDFILISPDGVFHALELKRRGETLSEDQTDFEAWCIEHEVNHAVAFSIDQVVAALGRWGALTALVAV